MGSNVSYVVEATILAIVAAWVIGHSEAFGTITTATSGAVVQSVQSLWASKGSS